jgi:hypothetical protein
MSDQGARATFDKAYKRTLKAVGGKFDPEHAVECWRAVERVRPWLFDAAASRLIMVSRFLPRPSEWVEACAEAGREHDAKRVAREARVLPANPDDQTFECGVCLDSGWQKFECKAAQLCTGCRAHGHAYDHPYVRMCQCRPTNETWRQNNPREIQGAQP